jgi:hypothetical protein
MNIHVQSRDDPGVPGPDAVAGQLGVDRAEIVRCETLSERHGHRIWRIHLRDTAYVLKWFPDPESALTEVAGYQLLQELGVPTLAVHGMDSQAILMEDLASSERWRLATEEDVWSRDTGRALGSWYQRLHCNGSRFLSNAQQRPTFLTRESDCLNPTTVLNLGDLLGLGDRPVWRLAAENIDLLRSAEAAMDLTLNYNDFHWTNLALSSTSDDQREAIVFDYHLLGVGTRYSDCRNVVGSLTGGAIEAFEAAYGDTDFREAVIDKPLSVLHSLVTATRRTKFPKWAVPSRDRAVSGGFERDLRDAIDLATALCREKR